MFRKPGQSSTIWQHTRYPGTSSGIHRGRGCYKKDTQTPWIVGIKPAGSMAGKGLPAFCLDGQTSAQGQCTAEIRTLYRLFPPGHRPLWLLARRAYSSERPEADSQLPVLARRPVGVSDKWVYVDPEPAYT